MTTINNPIRKDVDGNTIMHYLGVANKQSETYNLSKIYNKLSFENGSSNVLNVIVGAKNIFIDPYKTYVLEVDTDNFSISSSSDSSEFELIAITTMPNVIDAIDSFNNTIANLSQEINENTSQLAEKAIKVNNFSNVLLNNFGLLIAGIDSLTNGAGGDSYYDYLIPRLKAVFGDGGAGYLPFDYGKATTEGDIFGMGTGWNYLISSTDASKQYSLDGHGMYGNSLTNSYINYELASSRRNFTRCKVFYLKQSGGGTFNVGYLTTANGVINSQSVDTNGSLDLGMLDMPVMNKSNVKGVQVNNANGKITIFGAYFYCETGLATCRIGKGGLAFADIIALDNTFQAKWGTFLNPSVFLLNAGMNDGTDKITYSNWISTYVGRFPNTSFLFIAPNYNVANAQFLTDYESTLKSYAITNSKDFISNIKLFGTYETANANGLMLDTVHPNTKGNKMIANNILNYYSVPKLYVSRDRNKTAYSTDFTSATSFTPTLQIPQYGVYILNVDFVGNWKDTNHRANASYLVQYLPSDTYTINNSDLLGTMKKIGNILTFSFTSIDSNGLLTFSATQVNNSTATIKFTLTKIS